MEGGFQIVNCLLRIIFPRVWCTEVGLPQVIDTEIVVGTGVPAVIVDDVPEPLRRLVRLAESEFCKPELEHRLAMVRFLLQHLLKLFFRCR